MPELAEVEFFRKRWNPGLGQRVTRIARHLGARVFRDCDVALLERAMPGAEFLESEAHGKKLLFRFVATETREPLWLGLHLGMTGKLSAEAEFFAPARHDHLVLFQEKQALVFTDSRQFGRVQFARGEETPRWWRDFSPAILAEDFTFAHVNRILGRRERTPIKSVLLLQDAFPGIGNWMADEILWRAEIDPSRATGSLNADERRAVWREAREVTRIAMRTIGEDYRDPPAGWLFHERWGKGGKCPGTDEPLQRKIVGGRTTCWCPKRQK